MSSILDRIQLKQKQDRNNDIFQKLQPKREKYIKKIQVQKKAKDKIINLKAMKNQIENDGNQITLIVHNISKDFSNDKLLSIIPSHSIDQVIQFKKENNYFKIKMSSQLYADAVKDNSKIKVDYLEIYIEQLNNKQNHLEKMLGKQGQKHQGYIADRIQQQN